MACIHGHSNLRERCPECYWEDQEVVFPVWVGRTAKALWGYWKCLAVIAAALIMVAYGFPW